MKPNENYSAELVSILMNSGTIEESGNYLGGKDNETCGCDKAKEKKPKYYRSKCKSVDEYNQKRIRHNPLVLNNTL